jgi:hypothetical protein
MMFLLVVQRPLQRLIMFVIDRKNKLEFVFDKNALRYCGMRNCAGLQKYLHMSGT